MADRITASGIYDLTMAEYRGQPADALSMASSDAVLLTESTPAHLKASWAEDAEDDSGKAADIGTVIHTLLLEPHRERAAIVVIDAPDWRKKDAQDARNTAAAAGQIALLKKDFERAQAAVQAVQRHPLAAELLKEGKAEQSWFAKDKATGLYRKARPDFFNNQRILVDIKSVTSAHPEFLQRRVFDGGWFQQAPWHCHVAEEVQGEPVRGYCWLIVEQKQPHSVVIRKPSDTVLMHGDRLNKLAFETFARCAKTDQWPSWGFDVEDLSLPTYAFYRLEDEKENKPTRGYEALAWAAETGADPRS